MTDLKLSLRHFLLAILLFVLAGILLTRANLAERDKKQKTPRGIRGQISKEADETDLAEAKQFYFESRADLLRNRRASQCGSGLGLNNDESKANRHLVRLRDKLISDYKQRGAFPPAEYFFAAKPHIESTELFQILREMPKGGILHIHTSSTGRASWVVENAASRPNCYVYWEDDNGDHLKGQLGFYESGSEPTGFRPVQQVRDEVADFDQQLLGLITLGEQDARAPDVWKRFGDIFHRLHGFLHYQPVFLDYYRDAFETLLNDNIQYVELRAGLGTLYDLTGKKWTPLESVGFFKQVRNRVREKHPEFDLKLIASFYREADRQSVWENLKQTMELRNIHPNFVIGYDLVGEEDTGHTTLYYLDDWLRLRTLEHEYRIDLPFYFHDGESDWPDDENLYDAYLLGCRRIGHGFALFRSPHLEQDIVKAGIALEVCPVSNQVLHYVGDLRIHPAAGYLARGVPCVIGSDDPAIFGNEGLSYDFWEAVVAWELDLKAVKQLVLNSFQYSAMTQQEKDLAEASWEKKWEEFIKSVLARAENAEAGGGETGGDETGSTKAATGGRATIKPRPVVAPQ